MSETTYAGPIATRFERTATEVMTFPNGLQQWTFKASNGYGASVTEAGYGVSRGYYELAVLDAAQKITYSTSVTGNVLGWLDVDQVTEALDRIAELPATAKVRR